MGRVGLGLGFALGLAVVVAVAFIVTAPGFFFALATAGFFILPPVLVFAIPFIISLP